MEKTSIEIEVGQKKITLETGELALQATSSILARTGDTMVLVTVVEGKDIDLGYFPLSVEYVERLYAGGRIKGSRWVKREGRPSDDAILTARIIDRSIRPLFPKEYKKQVQIVITVLSVDGENEPDILSLIATSAALAISPIPWAGPVSAVRMGFVKEAGNGKMEYIVNPGRAEMEFSELDLIASQTAEKTLMLEAGIKEESEEIVIEAIKKAQEANSQVILEINKLVKKIGAKKTEVKKDAVLYETIKKIEKNYKAEVDALIPLRVSKESGSGGEDLVDKIYEHEKMANPDDAPDKKTISKALESVLFALIRENIIKKSKRPDGRKIDQLREISSQVSVLPRTHGSGVFQRGNTQALTIATLGSPRLEQLIESAEGEETKSYMHHYSMPPYSVGEAGRMGTPSRREIGHGALAERALEPVIPDQKTFPYTIRVVSEILSSNGSTSMAATCGSTLALMDAGVPIKSPIAGIAMGLMTLEEKYVILTDILGLEDFSGDMDFKVAGSDKGITAIQLDVKINGITIDQITETLAGAKKARLFILEKMLATISKSREEVSTYAPKIEQLQIPVDKIGEVIGPGGRVIKNIISQTGATVDVEDDGTVTISASGEESVEKAVEWINGLIREIEPGEIFENAEVKRILPFGAFVEVLPGKEGMVHVSKMSTEYVKNPEDVLSIGDKVKVRVVEIDDQGRMNLSMLFGEDADSGGRPPRREGGDGPPRREDSGGRPPRRDFGDRNQRSEGRREDSAERNPHPLAMQFRREKQEQRKRESLFRKPR